ncbi:hypothetical protein NJH78_27045, partial [Pseudomonas chlororaphis]|nr:hypothetical protein [Pseudomonas chlororaphis]
GSWLASEGVREDGAGLKGLFAGKPAPTGWATSSEGNCGSWLASEGVREDGAGLKGLFAGKPAPTAAWG